MAYEFKFPDVGEGITEGEIVSWKVKNGEIVKIDQVLAEIETAKAIVEIPSPRDGKIAKLNGKVGDTIKVGEVLVEIEDGTGPAAAPLAEKPTDPAEKRADAGTVMGVLPEYEEEVHPQHYFFLKNGDQIKSLAELNDALKTIDDDTFNHHVNEVKNDFANWIEDVLLKKELAANVRDAKTRDEISQILEPKAVTQETPPRAKAMPGTRKLAKEKGIDLATLQGTGKDGVVTKEDVQNVTGETPLQKKSGVHIVEREYDLFGYIETIPLQGIRKTIAQRMLASSQKTAPVTHFDEADVTKLTVIRKKHKEESPGVKLTYLPYIVKAVIAALKKHPYFNANVDDEKIVVKKYYNVGIAVDTDHGLMVPVIKIAEHKTLLDLAKEIESFAKAAQERALDLTDMQGGTFTISNGGSVGGLFATPIINYPEVAILFIGKLSEKPIVVNGEIQARTMMPLSLTFDHRIVDGAQAARFVNDIKSYLEDPDRLLLEL